MPSVADRLRNETRDDVRRLSAEARLELAFCLGEDDLEAFRSRRGLDRSAAIMELGRRRQSGRRHSDCMLARFA